MPALDVSFLLDDPDLCEAFTVIRRQQVLDENARTTVVETSMSAFGSIQPKDTAIGGNVREATPDAEYRAAALTVHTKFRLRSVSETVDGIQWQPDHVLFNGDRFLVELTNDYTHYGAGFVQADLASIPSQDVAPQ